MARRERATVRQMLIAISGIDGAGKSTQLAMLSRYLDDFGRVHVTLWHRPGYSQGLHRLKQLVRGAAPGALPGPGEGSARSRAFNRPGVSEAWLALAVADMGAQYAIKVRAHLAAGRMVLCDRYLDDGLMDLALRFPRYEAAIGRAGAVARRLCPRPAASFLLMLPWEESVRRLCDKEEPFPYSLEVGRQRYERYEQLARSGAFTVIDARPSPAEVHAAIRRVVETRANR